MKTLSILGSTGSIGVNTLDIVRSYPDRFLVVGLSCGKNISLLKEQITEFKPAIVSVQDPRDAEFLREAFRHQPLEIVSGNSGAIAVAVHPKTEMVVSGMVGAAGLLPTFRAIEAKKQIALANKETMVIAGELMNRAASKAGVKIFPVDSEHSAIFQCLEGHSLKEVRRLILTASGGPFLNKSLEELKKVTVAEALKHPNWKMGSKITIDSATLMNKGLEVIEARWLFDIAPENIDVCVHPQSVIHSMVEYCDGSVIAQLGIPDMRVPIAYAMSYPERLKNSLPALDLFGMGQFTFLKPDHARFGCLNLAMQALKRGWDTPCVLNAANEVAVKAFLEEQISFLEIAELIQAILDEHQAHAFSSVEELMVLDRKTRDRATELILNRALSAERRRG